MKEVGDSRDQHKERDIQQRYEPGLNGENRHVAGVDYPASDQDEKDKEKLQNALVDIARARRLIVCNDQTYRADRQRQSVDQVREGFQPRSRSSRCPYPVLSRQRAVVRFSLHMTLYPPKVLRSLLEGN